MFKKVIALLISVLIILLAMAGCRGGLSKNDPLLTTVDLDLDKFYEDNPTNSTKAKGAKYTTTFDESTCTLEVNAKGMIKDLYPRDWVPVDDTDYPEFLKADYKVKRLVIGEGITYLYNCFNDLKSLEEIVFPSSLKTIERSFMSCDALVDLNIPKTVKIIFYGSFNECASLKNIKFNGRINLSHPSSFYELESLEEIIIPANSVLCSAFDYCNNLKKVIIGANVACHEVFDAGENICEHNFSYKEGKDKTKIYIYKPLYDESGDLRLIEDKWGRGELLEAEKGIEMCTENIKIIYIK